MSTSSRALRDLHQIKHSGGFSGPSGLPHGGRQAWRNQHVRNNFYINLSNGLAGYGGDPGCSGQTDRI